MYCFASWARQAAGGLSGRAEEAPASGLLLLCARSFCFIMCVYLHYIYIYIYIYT